MMGYYDGYSMGFFGPFMMILFLALFIVCTVWLIRMIFPAMQKQANVGSDSSASARDILKLRFAKGELTADDYSKMLKTVDD